jgi:hypothetical protein
MVMRHFCVLRQQVIENSMSCTAAELNGELW